MEKAKKTNRPLHNRCVATLLTIISLFPCMPTCLGASNDSELNFKIYNPDASGQGDSAQTDNSPAPASDAAQNSYSKSNSTGSSFDLRPEIPVSAGSSPALSPNSNSNSPSATGLTKENLSPSVNSDQGTLGTQDSASSDLKKELPITDGTSTANPTEAANSSPAKSANQVDALSDKSASGSPTGESTATSDTTSGASPVPTDAENKVDSTKVLQGYVRVVPSGTKIPIIMDTAVDSDTSQEGDEFSARTSEDLTIDGATVVPAGSIIKGRIATLNAPKHMIRSGSVALKFDTVTTPDNRQIPLVANLVARGGVVHAKRGLKDVAIDTGVFALPTAIGLGIGVIAGHSSSSSISSGGAALIGAGVGAAVGLAVLLAKKGKKVDVRPGDELKIELAEDLHMPTM